MLVKELLENLSKRDPEAFVMIEVNHIYYDCIQVDPYEAESIGGIEVYIHATNGLGDAPGCRGDEDFDHEWYPE